MKKLLVVLLSAALFVSLCACSNGQGSSKEPSASETKESEAKESEAEAADEKAQEQEDSQQAESQEASAAEQETAEEPAEEPAETAEVKSFKAEGYTIYYEAVPEDKVDEVIGDLVEFIDTDGVDMEQNRLFYIHYTGAEQNGQEVQLSTIWRSISWGKILFTVDGVDYRQPSILMSSGTQTYITYLFVPAGTPDNADVSIKY